MRLQICLPFYSNLTVLQAVLKGLHQHNPQSEILIHPYTQDDWNLLQPVEETVLAPSGHKSMDGVLNHLLNQCSSDWVVFTEQDTFPHYSYEQLAEDLDGQRYLLAGPIDTMYYDNPLARAMPKYGTPARLSPNPGYLHSSLILANREHLSRTPKPFSLPEGFKLHGYGVLGGEVYYGLRHNCGEPVAALAFFHQRHGEYGYCADLTWSGIKLATHLYYSSTRGGYYRDNFLSLPEYEWLSREEERFIKDYQGA